MSTSTFIAGRVQRALGVTIATALVVFGVEATAQVASTSLPVGMMKVSLVGLDLSTADGVSAAHERVRKAARRICAKVATSADMSTNLKYITCIDEAMANSVAQIDDLARQSSARLARTSGH